MQLLESMLSKLVEEFENRLNSQNELVCLASFVHFLSVVFMKSFGLLPYGNTWSIQSITQIHNNTSFNAFGQVKAALKNGTDNTKSFSKSKVLAETTPSSSERKASCR
jgi:kinesin family member C2/C3